MDASCKIQRSIHDVRLTYKYVSRILGTYHGGTSAVITKNRYMSYAVPFILYYVLTVFQERYYQKAFFLSPRYWAASIYYNDIFCIAILAVGSFLTALIFMCAIERRLRYA